LKLLLPFRRIARREDHKLAREAVLGMVSESRIFWIPANCYLF